MAVTGFIGGGLKLEFFNSAISAAATITVPNGVQAGWLIVLLDHGASIGASVTDTVPSGFTRAVTTPFTPGLGAWRQTISFKIAAGNEGGTSITGINTNFNCKALAVFRTNKPIVSVNIGDPDGVATSGNPSAQTLAASGGIAALIALAGYGLSYIGTGSVDPRTFSPAKDGEVHSTEGTAATDLWLAYKIFNKQSQLADINIDMDDEGSVNILQSVYLECSA